MSRTFVISDTHFGHKGVTIFTRKDGHKLRPWDTVEEMDEAMVALWNSEVRPEDTVWHLGDVVINRKALPILGRLNGKKTLIKGNHDVFRLEEYQQYFSNVYAYRVHGDVLFSHIPVHPSQFPRFSANVHGHLHSDVLPDRRYVNVSSEQTGFKPILLEEVMRRVKNEQ